MVPTDRDSGMKILVFNLQVDADGQLRIQPDARLFPDSAVIQSHRPLFLPDFSEHFSASLSVAVRIGRLGKRVAVRYAHRYWNAVTVSMITGSDSVNGAGAQIDGFDGAVALGDWMDVDPGAQPLLQLSVESDSESWDLPEIGEEISHTIDQAITAASVYMTIKMGDIIAITVGKPKAVKIGDIIKATINGQELLVTKIK